MKKTDFPSLHFLRLMLLGLCALSGPVVAAPGDPAKPKKDDQHRQVADAFFAGEIRRLKVEITPEQLERLKKDERNYAEASVTESTPAGPKLYQKVAIKLKGSAGSFQHLDQKPGLTLSFDKFKGGERFNGMKKIHLNNCAQDGTYLNEFIAGEMARMAGVPASRCSHAFVELNGRDLGLYVVKEAFSKDFLAFFYSNPNGDLWDGGFCREIDENSEKDEGDPADKTAIRELIAACQEGDNAKRWARLGKVLDLEKFITHCGMEAILGHWDGYSFNRNNYRFYRDPDSGRFSFFLHGMDQMFADENFPLMRDWPAMVSGAVMRCPEGAELYKARLASLHENVLLKEDWAARVTAEGRQVQSAIAAKDARWAKEYENAITDARGKVTRRIAAVGRQIGAIPKPVTFDLSGALKLPKGWTFEPSGGGQGAEVKLEGRDCLHLVVPEGGTPSWRAVVRLEAGRYRFEGVARTRGLIPVDDEKGKGAGLRISGGAKRANVVEGDAPWKPVTYEFETPGGDIALVAELRGQKGEVWFAMDSLRIIKGK